MTIRKSSIKLIGCLALFFQLFAFAAEDANSLYQKGLALEREGKFYDALASFNRVITEFPTDSLAGNEQAVFHSKFVALGLALENDAIASAREIADDIKVLASSLEKKPSQLYSIGWLFEKNRIYSDALAFYQQIIADYPNSVQAGADCSGFQLKSVTLKMAIETGDIAAARQIADAIRSLPSSAAQKPVQLYAAGWLFEKEKLYPDALAFYQQVVSEYPDSKQAGADFSAFNLKSIACKQALENGDTAAARQIADQIRSLPSSSAQKPAQLYATGMLFETNKLYSDALAFYRQIITDYPNSVQAGADFSAYREKFNALRLALEDDDIASARQIAEAIRSLPSSAVQKPVQLYQTGREFEFKEFFKIGKERSLVDETLGIGDSFYNDIVENEEYAENEYFLLAQIQSDVLAVLKLINNGQIQPAELLTSQIKTKYAGNAKLARELLSIAEAYYLIGLNLNENAMFLKSIDLFENNIPAANDPLLTASIYYMLGLNYQQQNDYTKAADVFRKAYQVDSKFKHADYCLFAQGHCYEKLMEDGVVSQDEAKVVIRTVHAKLISEFPQSYYLVSAEDWPE